MTYIDRPAPLIRRDPASEYDLEPSPPPLTLAEHVRLFLFVVAVCAPFVAALIVCAWIGGVR